MELENGASHKIEGPDPRGGSMVLSILVGKSRWCTSIWLQISGSSQTGHIACGDFDK